MHLYKLTERVIHEGFDNIFLASDYEYSCKQLRELIDGLREEYEKSAYSRYGWLNHVTETLISEYGFYEPKIVEYETFFK